MLDAATIAGFSESILKPQFDAPLPTPDFHRQMWELCTSEHTRVAIAAPRNTAKSTAVTHTFVLAEMLFRERGFALIISDTEAQARMFLGDIRNELAENQKLRRMFGVLSFDKETETTVEVRCKDGWKFKISVKGSGQKLRGTKWDGKRPDLIVVDDLENEELVGTPEARYKLRRWFKGALVPALSKNGIVRVVGTILHMDSLLENLLKSKFWESQRYRAHNLDFTELLWPEKLDEKELRRLKAEYTEDGMQDLYFQEYLNEPIDEENAMFKRNHLKPIENKDEPLTYYAAGDFAISKASYADYTVIAVCGINAANTMKIVDIRRGRWDAFEIIEEMMDVQRTYNPEIFTVEKGAIEKSLGPALEVAQRDAGIWIDLNPQNPDKDKVRRAKSFSVRVRRGAVEFDKEAWWWEDLLDELIRFPKAKHDDIVDALAWLGLTVDQYTGAPTEEQAREDAYENELEEYYDDDFNLCTGY